MNQVKCGWALVWSSNNHSLSGWILIWALQRAWWIIFLGCLYFTHKSVKWATISLAPQGGKEGSYICFILKRKSLSATHLELSWLRMEVKAMCRSKMCFLHHCDSSPKFNTVLLIMDLLLFKGKLVGHGVPRAFLASLSMISFPVIFLCPGTQTRYTVRCEGRQSNFFKLYQKGTAQGPLCQNSWSEGWFLCYQSI